MFSVIVAVVIYLILEPLFRLMGASDDVIPYIHSYMNIMLIGTPMMMMIIISNNAFRAIGNVKASAAFSTMLALLNLGLDPLLIFGLGPFPEMGIRGAAVATVIAVLITWSSAFYVLGFHEKLLDFSIPKFSHLIPNWRDLMSIGIPSIGANVMTPVAAAVMTAMIARFGSEAVAGFGVGSRIEALSLIVVFALSSTLPMFIGQNIGAGKGERAYLALMGCLRFSLFFQTGVYALLLLFLPYIAEVFSGNMDVIQVIMAYLLILPLTYGAHAIVILTMVSLNVLRRPRTALLITIIRLLLLYLPLAYIGSKF